MVEDPFELPDICKISQVNQRVHPPTHPTHPPISFTNENEQTHGCCPMSEWVGGWVDGWRMTLTSAS